MWSYRVAVFLLAAGALLGQHEFSPVEVEGGRRVFLSNCVVCHGTDGGAVPGSPIGLGKFKRATTDGELNRIIRNGIPNTAMPPHTLPEFQVRTVVTYLRFLGSSAADAAANKGDRARGKAVLEGKGGCLTCHRVNSVGARQAPELSDIGARRRASDLERSVVNPDAEVLPQNRSVRAVTREGATITGKLLNHDAFTVQLFDSNERLLSLTKANLKEFSIPDKSPMPAYRDKLSRAELEDLIAYLVSLKGTNKP